MASNRGKAVFRISPMARERRGITTSRIAASLPFIINAINNAPTNIPGARRAIFKPMVSTFCTCWISLVRRVTREPVLKLSMLAKENCCSFANSALRISAPTPWPHRAENMAEPCPSTRDIRAKSTICSPFIRI